MGRLKAAAERLAEGAVRICPKAEGAIRALLSESFLRFLGVGMAAAATYSASVAAGHEWFGMGDVSASIAGFFFGTLVSYVGNSALTFNAKQGADTLWRFVVVTLVGFGLNTLLTGLVSAVGLHYGFGVALVLTTVPVFNYLGHHFWTYRHKK